MTRATIQTVGRRESGFAYLMVLGFVAVMGIGLAAVAQVWSTASQRDREQELLFIGNEFRAAIGSYYEKSPGAKQYPRSLDDLLDDKRFPVPTRHLRRLYVDPMTGSTEWGLVRQEERIVGVHSLSEARPFKAALFGAQDEALADAESYAQWNFVYKPAGRQADARTTARDPAASARPGPATTGETAPPGAMTPSPRAPNASRQ